MTELEQLLARFALPEKEVALLQQKINEYYTRNIHPSSHPRVVILGAQPGAGKTELQNIALRQLEHNAVINNADDYRDFHPQAHLIKQHHERYYPELTASYAQHWAVGLQHYCRENGLSYTLETTLRDGKRLNDTMAAIKEHGFAVEMKILAVHGSVSLLSAYARYEDMKQASGSGRAVFKEAHDARYNAIPHALAQIEEAKLYDRISIYGRRILGEGTAEERSGVVHIATDSFSPLQAYLRERNRVLSQEEKRVYNKVYEQVASLMKDRKATADEIKLFKSALQVFPLRYSTEDKGRSRER